MKTKTIIPIAIAALFVSMVFIPAISATEVRIAWVEKEDGPVQVEKIDLETDDYTNFINILKSFAEWMDGARPFSDYKLDDTEIAEIKGYITELKEILKDSPLLQTLTPEMLAGLLFDDTSGGLLKCCVLSIGWGKSLMPFNPYEWGFSGGTPFVRPLTFLHFPVGYTGTIKYRPPLGAMGWDKMGPHLITVQGLQGLWIDGGALGYKRPFSMGIEFIIGRGRVLAFGRH